jgi:Skp family chaperone for outer membrane proteins
MCGNVIVVGDVQQVATYVETILQINQTLREMKSMNAELQAKFDKLDQDIQARNQADTAKDQQIAALTGENATLTQQVATLTAADQATAQEVGAAIDQADAALLNPAA